MEVHFTSKFSKVVDAMHQIFIKLPPSSRMVFSDIGWYGFKPFRNALYNVCKRDAKKYNIFWVKVLHLSIALGAWLGVIGAFIFAVIDMPNLVIISCFASLTLIFIMLVGWILYGECAITVLEEAVERCENDR